MLSSNLQEMGEWNCILWLKCHIRLQLFCTQAILFQDSLKNLFFVFLLYVNFFKKNSNLCRLYWIYISFVLGKWVKFFIAINIKESTQPRSYLLFQNCNTLSSKWTSNPLCIQKYNIWMKIQIEAPSYDNRFFILSCTWHKENTTTPLCLSININTLGDSPTGNSFTHSFVTPKYGYHLSYLSLNHHN